MITIEIVTIGRMFDKINRRNLTQDWSRLILDLKKLWEVIRLEKDINIIKLLGSAIIVLRGFRLRKTHNIV